MKLCACISLRANFASAIAMRMVCVRHHLNGCRVVVNDWTSFSISIDAVYSRHSNNVESKFSFICLGRMHCVIQSAIFYGGKTAIPLRCRASISNLWDSRSLALLLLLLLLFITQYVYVFSLFLSIKSSFSDLTLQRVPVCEVHPIASLFHVFYCYGLRVTKWHTCFWLNQIFIRNGDENVCSPVTLHHLWLRRIKCVATPMPSKRK